MTTSEPAGGVENEGEACALRPTDSGNTACQRLRFPIVGIGASAGGIRALQEFFAFMPADSGMAFVVVTHRSPGTPSVLPELLARTTDMPVVEVSVPTPLEANHVYTVHSGYEVTLRHGVLHPEPVQARTGLPMSIDQFFQSLARDQHEFAVGVILSGLGTDGSVGIKSIKDERGMVIVQ